MNWLLPSFIRLKLPRFPALWLPMFLLLWPLVFVVFALGLLFTLFIASSYPSPALRGGSGPRARALELLGTFWRVLCALRGTRVDVQQRSVRYELSFH